MLDPMSSEAHTHYPYWRGAVIHPLESGTLAMTLSPSLWSCFCDFFLHTDSSGASCPFPQPPPSPLSCPWSCRHPNCSLALTPFLGVSPELRPSEHGSGPLGRTAVHCFQQVLRLPTCPASLPPSLLTQLRHDHYTRTHGLLPRALGVLLYQPGNPPAPRPRPASTHTAERAGDELTR